MTCTASTRTEKKKIATTSSKRCVEKTSTTALRAKDEKEQLVKRVIRRGKKCFNPSSSGLESVSAVPRSGKPLRRKFRRLFVTFGSVSRCRGLLPDIHFFSFCCRSIWRECSENAKKNRSPRVPSGSVSAAPCVVRRSRVWCVHHRRSKLRRLLHLSSRWGWGRAHCSSSSAGRGSFWESFFSSVVEQ